jgi:hypothetical protein
MTTLSLRLQFKLIRITTLALLSVFGVNLHAQVKHLGVSEVTNFVSCAQNVLHKRVILDSNLPFKEFAALCGNQDHDAFINLLKQHQVAVREDGDWAYLLHASYFGPWTSYTPESDRLKWKHFQVDVSARSADPQYHQNEVILSAAQLIKLKEQVLDQARLIPIFPPRTQSENEIAKIKFDLQVFVRHVRKDAPSSVVVLLREADDFSVAGRITYGEQQSDGSFKLLWDSPILVARFSDVSFLDVNNDGVEEITVKGAYPGGMRDLAAITIFNIQGQELTRQSRCLVPDLYGYSQEDGSCPIVADSVDFDYSHGPPFDIEATSTLVSGKDAVFKLLGNHYVHPSSTPRIKNKAEAPR